MLLIFDLILLLYASCQLTQWIHLFKIDRIIFGWIIFLSANVLTGYGLSLIGIMNQPWAWLIVHGIILIGIIKLRNKTTHIVSHPHEYSFDIKTLFFELPLWIKTILFFFALACVASLILHFKTHIPLNQDAVNYHLPRAGHYYFQGSLNVYPSTDVRETDFPHTYELFIVWIIAMSKEIRFIYLFQWISLFIAALAIYSTCRKLNVCKAASIAAVLIWLVTPFIVLNLNFVKNDLLLACIALYLLPFLLSMHDRFWPSLIAVACCCGLAIGIKYNAIFMVFAVLLVVIIKRGQSKAFYRDMFASVVGITLSCMILGGYAYFETWQRTGSPIASLSGSQTFEPYAISVNALRLTGEMTDSLGFISKTASQYTGQALNDVRSPLFASLSQIEALNAYESRHYWAWKGPARLYRLSDQYNQFSLGHFFMLVLGLVAALRFIKTFNVMLVVLLFLFAYIPQAGTLKWQPIDNLRFYFPLLSWLYPFIGLYLHTYLFKRRLFHWVCALSCGFGVIVMIEYFKAPLMHWPQADYTAKTLERLEVPSIEKTCMHFVETLPHDATLAIEAGCMDSTYLLMIPHFQRHITPIPPQEDITDAIHFFQKIPALDGIIIKQKQALPADDLEPYKIEEIRSNLVYIYQK